MSRRQALASAELALPAFQEAVEPVVEALAGQRGEQGVALAVEGAQVDVQTAPVDMGGIDKAALAGIVPDLGAGESNQGAEGEGLQLARLQVAVYELPGSGYIFLILVGSADDE